MVIHIRSKNPQFYKMDQAPESWRDNFGTHHLESMFLALDDGKLVGRVGVYLNPHFENQGIGFLGAFEVINEYKVSEELLSSAVAYLNQMGIQQVIGPVDGSTWETYRFREAGGMRPFFMEPNQADWYLKHWKKFGFKEAEKYQSNLMNISEVNTDFLKSDTTRLKENGVRLRNFNPDNAADELKLLAEFNQKAFMKNFLFSPFSIEQFVSKYLPLVPFFDPDLIFIAEDAEGMAGLAFAIPDHLDQNKECAVIKTLARRPDTQLQGLGRHLSHRIIKAVREKGYKYLIHALMKTDNASLSISQKLNVTLYSSYSLLKYN